MKLSVLSVTLILVLLACTHEPPSTADLVIRGATLIDGTGSPPQTDVSIVISDGVIQQVGGTVDVQGRDEIDANGKWIVPGFVDVHMHFQEAGGLYTRPDMYDLTEYFPFESERKAIVDNIESTLARHLCAGVTTAIEVGGPGWSFEIRQLAQTLDKAPRVYVAGPFIGFGEMPELWMEEDPSIVSVLSPDATPNVFATVLRRQPDLIKIGYVGGDLDGFGEFAERAANLTHQAGLRLFAHTFELESAKRAIRAGANTLVHSVFDQEVDDEFLDLAKRSSVIYAATAKVWDGYHEVLTQQRELLPIERTCGNPRSISSWGDLSSIDSPPPIPSLLADVTEVSRHAITNLAKVHDAGIRIATGSDAGNIGTLHGASLHREFHAMAEAGMQPMEIIVAATRNGARTLSENPDFGTIEAGRRADLLILDANPLDDIANLQRIETVISRGSMFSQGELTD